jgi:hypothetical protein
MKFVMHKLRIGDLVWAQVVECIGTSEFIVSFQGDLIRVRNESLTQLPLDEKVLVKVASVNPLTFQLLSDADRKRGATRINISV